MSTNVQETHHARECNPIILQSKPKPRKLRYSNQLKQGLVDHGYQGEFERVQSVVLVGDFFASSGHDVQPEQW